MLLELNHISKSFPQPGGRDTLQVLADVSLSLDAGSSLAIVGPSGSGKSTLLNIMGTLDKPSSGAIRLEGKDLLTLTPGRLAEMRNRELGFIFQLHHLLPQCTVLENVLLPTLASGRKRDSAALSRRAFSLLERAGLADRVHYKPGQLSGGELQRTAVVRALINRPRLVLADEPTGSLDNITAQNLAGLLQQLNEEEQVTLVVVTHSRELAGKMKQVMVLHNGRLEL